MALPDMIGLTVRDIQASLDFYRLLGLDTPEIAQGEDYAEVITPNGYRISWNGVEMAKQLDPGWQEPVGQRIALAFKCADPAEVDSLYSQVVAAGHTGHTPPFDAFWGQRYASVKDPDGNTVDLFAPQG